jgi:hypothetical protein
MRTALDRFMCRCGAHRWTKPFCIQCPSVRIVSRYCTRCDATRHVEQHVWSEPTRNFTLAVQQWLDSQTWYPDGVA